MTHRSEISELNKLAADIAIREQTDSNPSEVDLSNIPDLPVGSVNGHVLRRRRGTKSDEQCVAEICELVANSSQSRPSLRRGPCWHLDAVAH